MIRKASRAHLSQMYTRGPATSFATSASVRRQNEQRSFLKNIAHLVSMTAPLSGALHLPPGHLNAEFAEHAEKCQWIFSAIAAVSAFDVCVHNLFNRAFS